MKLTVTHLEGRQRMRTTTMTGYGEWPVVGLPLSVWNEQPLDENYDARSIMTSPVRELQELEDGSVNIRTNSGTLYNVKGHFE